MLGIVVAMTIACALIIDFLLLPALLIMLDGKRKTDKVSSPDTPPAPTAGDAASAA